MRGLYVSDVKKFNSIKAQGMHNRPHSSAFGQCPAPFGICNQIVWHKSAFSSAAFHLLAVSGMFTLLLMGVVLHHASEEF